MHVFQLTVCVIILHVSIAAFGQDKHCTQWYTSNAGNNCTYCTPGTYKHDDCEKDGESAICKGCPLDHYQTFCNQALSCEPCSSSCKWRYSKQVQDCTLYNDIQCECEEGRYWQKETENDGVCLKHTECPAGQGLLRPGTPWNNTRCLTCIEGRTFSRESSLMPCSKCTVCNRYKRTCTLTADAVCDTNTAPGKPPSDQSSSSIAIVVCTITGGVVVGIVLLVMALWCKGVIACRRRHGGQHHEDGVFKEPPLEHCEGKPTNISPPENVLRKSDDPENQSKETTSVSDSDLQTDLISRTSLSVVRESDNGQNRPQEKDEALSKKAEGSGSICRNQSLPDHEEYTPNSARINGRENSSTSESKGISTKGIHKQEQHVCDTDSEFENGRGNYDMGLEKRNISLFSQNSSTSEDHNSVRLHAAESGEHDVSIKDGDIESYKVKSTGGGYLADEIGSSISENFATSEVESVRLHAAESGESGLSLQEMNSINSAYSNEKRNLSFISQDCITIEAIKSIRLHARESSEEDLSSKEEQMKELKVCGTDGTILNDIVNISTGISQRFIDGTCNGEAFANGTITYV